MSIVPVMTARPDEVRGSRAILFGRFMLPDESEHPCQVSRLSPEGAVFLTGTQAPAGLGIVAYIDEIGRLEAVVGAPVDGGFAVSFRISGARRERIESRIRSLHDASDKDDADALAHRRDPRQEETGSASRITLADGRVYPCQVLDVSVSGAAVKTDVIPMLGMSILLGKMQGRVVRYLDSGVAIEFCRRLESPALPQQPC